MDRYEKRLFIDDLCDSIKLTVVDSISKMPEEWDGFELRELIAEKATQSAGWLNKPENRKRRKDYRNTVIVRNL